MKKNILLVGSLLGILVFGSSCMANMPNKKYTTQDITRVSDQYQISQQNTKHSDSAYNGVLNLNGRTTQWEVVVKEDSVFTITYDIQNTKGIFKLVLTDNKHYVKNIVSLKAKDSSDGVKDIELKKGTYFIKFTGEKSASEIKASFDFPQDKISCEYQYDDDDDD
ncbi:hypothetical protein [Vagococcus silagei]|uniref:Lipoprotein n=1 Tax=Vagococcus silagei TaxID=2508885 RepID=A0A4S3B513_9ENTE|nr:hypothetical protein [Vagococcus silagei]THB61568.1 hypothetical protein ESZ54_04935 [Vagococcus silagei]